MLHFRPAAAIAVLIAVAIAASPPDPVRADRPDAPTVTALPAFELAPLITVDVAVLERADANAPTNGFELESPIEATASTNAGTDRMRDHWRGSRPDLLLTLVSQSSIDNPWRPPNRAALAGSRLLV